LSPPARKGRGEEAEPDPAVFQLLAAARGSRAASGGAAWEDAPPLFQRPETFRPLFLQIPKGFPAVSCYFLGVGSVILEC
jgi:hypothetical protein